MRAAFARRLFAARVATDPNPAAPSSEQGKLRELFPALRSVMAEVLAVIGAEHAASPVAGLAAGAAQICRAP